MPSLRLLALCLFLGSLFPVPPVCAAQEQVYVDAEAGDDARSGLDEANAVRTLTRAAALIGESGTIHCIPRKTPFRETLHLRVGGREGAPLVVEGNGAVIDLGTDITEGPWKEAGGEWTLERDVRPSTRPVQVSSLFVDNEPLWVPHEKEERPQAFLRITPEGRFAVTFPAGKTPRNSRVTLTAPENQSGVFMDQGDHIVIRNLTVRYAGNDGFNLHGRGRNIVLENVRALLCGDQGISSHSETEMIIRGAEVAFCGSRAGGIADIGNSHTSYTNVILHHNRKPGVHLRGARHEIDGMVIFANGPAKVPAPAANLTVRQCVALDDAMEIADSSADTGPDKLTDLIDAAREAQSKAGRIPYPGIERSLMPPAGP